MAIRYCTSIASVNLLSGLEQAKYGTNDQALPALSYLGSQVHPGTFNVLASLSRPYGILT